MPARRANKGSCHPCWRGELARQRTRQGRRCHL